MFLFVIRALSVVLSVLVTALALGPWAPLSAEEAAATAAVENIPVQEDDNSLHILQCRADISQAIQQVVDQYASTNPARISVQTVEGSDYGLVLRSKLLSGERVDLFHIQTRRDLVELEPHLDDLADLVWLRSALPGTLDGAELNGKSLGVPYSVEGAGLLVNTELFAKANVYLGSRPTLESLEEAFRELQDVIDSGDLGDTLPELEAVTEFAAQDKAYTGTLVADLVLAESFGNGSAAMDGSYLELPLEEQAKEFLRLLALYSTCTSWGQLNEVTQGRQLDKGIAAGRVAAVYQNADVYRSIVKANPSLEGKLRLMPVPVGTEAEPRAAILTGVPAYWCVNAGSDDGARATARRFLTWLYQSESGAALYAGRFGALSPFRESAKAADNPMHEQILAQMEQGNALPMLHSGFPAGFGDDCFAVGLQSYLSRDLTWEELVQSCKEQWYRDRTPIS